MLFKLNRLLPILVGAFFILLIITYAVYSSRIKQLTVEECAISMSKNQYGATIAAVSANINNPTESTIGSFYFYVRFYDLNNPETTLSELGYQVSQSIPPKESVVLSYNGLVREKLENYGYECKIKMF